MKKNVVDVISDKYDGMTKKQRMLCDFMLQKPEEMSFMTLKELAMANGISEMTVLNACKMLEYSNYNELKYEFRKYNSACAKTKVQKENLYANPLVPEYELGDKMKLLHDICEEEHNTINLLMAQLDENELMLAAEMLLDATNIVFCARGVSVQIADFLSMRMATMGLPSIVVNTELNDSVQAALPLMTKGVLVVPISLPDYYLMTTKICEFAKKQHATVLCITDNEKESPVAQYGDLVLRVPCNTRLFLSSPAPVMMMANLLSTALNIEKSTRKTNKYATSQEFTRLFWSER